MKPTDKEPSELETLMMGYDLDVSPVFERNYKTGKHHRVWCAGRRQFSKLTGVNFVGNDDFVKSTTDCGPLEVARLLVAKLKKQDTKRSRRK